MYFDVHLVLPKARELECGRDKIILGVLDKVQPRRGTWSVRWGVRGSAWCAYVGSQK